MISYLCSAACFVVGMMTNESTLMIAAGLFAVAGSIACKK